MKKYFLFLLIVFSTFSSLPVYATDLNNSGFIPGQIWYSDKTLTEGDTVNIHTAIWNGEKDSISVKVEFYDKNVILGSRDVILAPLQLKDVFIPWKITSGDHVISAKIISSTATISGKKEKILLGVNTTSSDKQFVSVVVKNSQGVPISGSDALKDQINKTSSEINSVVPEKVSTYISDSFNTVEDFRNKTFTQVDDIKNETQKEIDLIKKDEEKVVAKIPIQKNDIEDAIEKPIAYIKLFLFSLLAFVLGNKIVFYGLLIFIAFYILRSVYRRVRNK